MSTKTARGFTRKRRGRATRLAPIDASKVLDPGGALAETYQKAVAAAIPASVEISETFWDELRIRIDLFLQLHERRLRTPLSRQYWERLAWLVEELASALRHLRRTTPWDHANSPWPSRALAGLWEVKVQCDARLDYNRIKAEAFRRGAIPIANISIRACSIFGAVLDNGLDTHPVAVAADRCRASFGPAWSHSWGTSPTRPSAASSGAGSG